MSRFTLDTDDDPDVFVTRFAKGTERYIFFWHEDRLEELLATIDRFRRDRKLSLTRAEAKAIIETIYKQLKEPCHDDTGS